MLGLAVTWLSVYSSFYFSRTSPIGFIGAKFGIGEHSQGQAKFLRDFAAFRDNHLENLVFGSLDRCPCNAQINPSRTAPKEAMNERGRIKTQKNEICRQRK